MKKKQSTIEVLKKQVKELTASLNEANYIKENFRLIQFTIDKFSEPAFWMKKDCRFIYVNDAACSSLGYTKEELLSMCLFDIDIKYREENREAHWKDLKEKKTIIFESIHKTKEGLSFPVEITANFIEFKGEEYNCAFARNISKRRETEKELKTSANILENVAEAIIATDRNFVITGWNNSAERMYGWKKEEVIGRRLKDILKFEYPGDSRDTIAGKFINDGFYKGEIIHHKKGGTPMTVFSSVSVIKDKRGNIIGAVSINSDITEQKRVEEELKLSEERFRVAFHTSPNLININRMEDGKYVDINEAFTKITGYTMDDVHNKTSLEINIWKNPELRDKVITQLKENGVVKNLDAEFVMKDGSIRYGLMSANVIYIGDEKHTLSVTCDITEQKLAEKTLIESEAKFKDLTEKSLVGVYLIVDGLFKYVNPKLVEIFGYTVDELIDKLGPEDLVLPEDWSIVNENLRKRIRGEISSVNYTLRARKKAGNIIFTEVYGSRTIYNGKPAIIGTLIDITDRMQMEMDLRNSEARYHRLFEDSPISLLEEDFSELMSYIDELKNRGVSDFRKYFYENPDDVRLCAEKVKLLDLNNTTLTLYQAVTKEELLGDLSKLLNEKALWVFKEELIALAERKTRFESEAEIITMQGNYRNIYLRLYVGKTEEGEYNYSRVLLAINDITEHKNNEKKIEKKSKYLEWMHRSSLKLAKVKSEEDIYSMVTEQIRQFTDAFLCTFSEYVPAKNVFILKSQICSQRKFNRLKNILDRKSVV